MLLNSIRHLRRADTALLQTIYFKCGRLAHTLASLPPQPSGALFARQADVQALPLPPLEDTMERFVEYLAPLSTADELEDAKRLTRSFMDGDGAQLHCELAALHAEALPRGGSYVSGFWHSMYLEIRAPLPLNVTPFLMMTRDERRPTQVRRAAHLAHASAEFAVKIRDGSLEPDVERDGRPLDSRQHRMLFGTARVPAAQRDELYVDEECRHIIVLRGRRFYVVDVLESDGRTPVSEARLGDALQRIVDDTFEGGASVASLTSTDRELWASTRAALLPNNLETLRLIDSALVVLCLDRDEAASIDELRAMLHGSGDRDDARWWDKLQLVVKASGEAGLLLEHTPVDGHAALRYCQHLTESAERTSPPSSTSGDAPELRQLVFKLDHNLHRDVLAAHEHFLALGDTYKSCVLDWREFGTNVPKSAGMSPDAFFQQAFQLAYYRAHGRIDSTYESCNTKRFLGGRTETIRSVTRESQALVLRWDSADDATRFDLLKAAADAHVRRANECKEGLGVDRHLFALACVAHYKQRRLMDYDVPELLRSPLYARLATSVLSTSQVSAPFFTLFGFGPVCSEGYGFAYNLGKRNFMLNVTSLKNHTRSDADLILDAVHDLLPEMRDCCLR